MLPKEVRLVLHLNKLVVSKETDFKMNQRGTGRDIMTLSMGQAPKTPEPTFPIMQLIIFHYTLHCPLNGFSFKTDTSISNSSIPRDK